ncbi:MAG TPA: efflux RND transporter periplasmic adaptor subunit [Thermodesulfobacteriota bacterium]
MEPSEKRIDVSSLRIDRSKPSSRRNRLRYFVALSGLAVICILLILGLLDEIPFLNPIVSTATVSRVSASEASTLLTSSGYVIARKKAEISPKSVGRISWINLEEGQKVEEGELVARLENQELKAQRDEIASNLDNARTESRRQEELFAKGVISPQTLDNAKTQVRVLEAKLRNADELIHNTQIYAPITGVVTVKKAFLGETVTPQGFGGAGSAGATFAVIVDLDSLEAETDVNEQNLGKIKVGMPAEIILDAFPEHRYKARLRQIVPTADRQKGTVTVKVEFLNKDDRVLPEMSCKIDFLDPAVYKDGIERNLILVPASSIVDHEGKKGVFIVDNYRAGFQPVTTGDEFGTQMEIREGLAGGEQVVREAGKSNLKDGDKIRLEDEEK